MMFAFQRSRTRAAWLALAAALSLVPLLAAAADDKKEKPVEKKPADPKKGDPKAAANEAPPVITNTPPILVSFPKAVFNTALEAGKDPFFPASKRRFPKPPDPVKPPPVSPPTNPTVVVTNIVTTNLPPATTNAVTPPGPPPPPPPTLIGSANLSLRGVVGSKTRRLAVIHSGVTSYTFSKGETMLIRLPNDKTLKVRCLDITERSAIFQAEGEPDTKEIFLREGL